MDQTINLKTNFDESEEIFDYFLEENDLQQYEELLNTIQPHISIEDDGSVENTEEENFHEFDSTTNELNPWKLSNGDDLCQELHEISKILCDTTSSTGYVLYVVDPDKNEIYICPKNSDDILKKRFSWEIKSGSTIAAYVAFRNKPVIIAKSEFSNKYPNGQGQGSLYSASVLAVPIQTDDGCIVGVLELCRDTNESYSLEHAETVQCAMSCIAEVTVLNKERITYIKQLHVTEYSQDIFSKEVESDFDRKDVNAKLWLKLLRNNLNAQCAVLYTVSSNKLKKTYVDENDDIALEGNLEKLKFSKLLTIAEVSYKSRSSINITDAYNDPRFDKEVDRVTGKIVRSVVCVPLMFQNKKIVGVVQVVNKISNDRFHKEDEMNLMVCADFLLHCMHSRGLKKKLILEEKEGAVLEGMVFDQIFRKIQEPEAVIIDTMELPKDFNSVNVSGDNKSLNHLVKQAYAILKTMCTHVLPNDETLLHFIFYVKKTYRDLPYHNFRHAYMTLQFVYLTLIRNPGVFDEIEMASMLIAALCHDADHRGVTENFSKCTEDPLITLYEKIPLENHHVWVGNFLIKISNLLSHLSMKECEKFLKIFKECILATNLLVHLKIRTQATEIITTREINWQAEKERRLVRCIVMASADFCGQAMQPEISHYLAEQLFKEFFTEGNTLNNRGCRVFLNTDRQNAPKIPNFQVDFIMKICLPCFDALGCVLDNMEDVYEMCKQVHDSWCEVKMQHEDSIDHVLREK